MSKVERLLNLTMALLGTPRPLTAAELRERIPGYPDGDASFRRAFERDKEALREMGIPVSREEIAFTDPPLEGYRIAEEEYYLRDPGFEPDELAALHLAASVARLDAGSGQEALWKLGGIVAGADDAAVATDDTLEDLVELPNDPNLAPLFGAAVDGRRVELVYHGTRRAIDPYRLDFRRGHWYLTGFDHSRAEERNYRLDRIEGRVEPGPRGAFERPSSVVPGGPAEPWQFGDDDPVTARVLVDPGHAAALRRHLTGPGGDAEDVSFDERDDGSVVADVTVTNWPAFRSLVLTFLDHAELLGPPELRADLVAWLEACASAETVGSA